MITIDSEALQQNSQLAGFSNFVEKYLAKSQNLVVPGLGTTLESDIFYLVRFSKIKPFDQKYKMRPDYMSYDEYGTVCLDKLLMYVNNVFCVEEFDLDDVIVPTRNTIVTIAKNRVRKRVAPQPINW